MCGLGRPRFCFLDLFVEKLVERSNQVLWWTLLYDVPHFSSKTYRSDSGQRPGSRQHDIDDEPFHCLAASLWKEPICDHARVCCGALHGIQWHSRCRGQRELSTLHVGILSLVLWIVVISEGACLRLHSKDARLYSTLAIEAGGVVTCRPVHGARCWRKASLPPTQRGHLSHPQTTPLPPTQRGHLYHPQTTPLPPTQT